MEVTPVLLTRGEFMAVQEFRTRPGQKIYSEPLLDAVFKLLAMMATGKTVVGSTEMTGFESSNNSASTQGC